MALGAVYTVSVPDVATLLADGYTHVRIYWASSENGVYSLEESIALVSGTYVYEYNHTTGAAGDWAKHAFYGATPGESVSSEPVPIAPVQSTRTLIRQGVGRRLRLMEGPYTITTATDGDTLVLSELADADGRAERYANWFGRSTTQVRQIRNSTNGYTAATGTLNFRRAFSPTLSNGDPLEMWKPRANEDPSAMIDEAMQRARRWIWWEEIIFITGITNTSEYPLPNIITNRGQVKRVEWATDDYPDRPGWQPIPKDVLFDGGPRLSIGSAAWGIGDGDIIRVVINRFGDRMDGESDYWAAPLEWCIAETAREFLQAAGSPVGKIEDVRDYSAAKRLIESECFEYRALYMPHIDVTLEPPL